MADQAGVRIHRALAMAGVASRRGAEVLVSEGRVLVNDAPAAIGQIVTSRDRIRVDGELVRAQATQIYLLNKPAGVISSASDPQGRPTVLDALPQDVRLYPVGRLDIETTGALLVTNDGDLAHRLMHPSSGVIKVYEALVNGRISADTIRILRKGVNLDDGSITAPCACEVMDKLHPKATWLRFELHEGKNRQIRRMCEAVGHRVIKLHRPAYANLALRGLSRGEWRALSAVELRKLASLVGLER